MGWLTPRRLTEASVEQLVATGALGTYGYDPIDNDRGFVQLGAPRRAIPPWTFEKARAYSIASYRANPMARAIIDTYTSFCIGDSGLALQVTNDDVRKVAEEFWTDPRNALDEQSLMLRSHLLYGESVYEMMTGATTGVVRRSVIDPTSVVGITLDRGNPLWPAQVVIRTIDGNQDTLDVIQVDELSGLRQGEVLFWASFKALEMDRRGDPFLAPVLDWLDNYDRVLSNLIDRTALGRFIAFDVTLKGDKTNQDIDDFIRARGGTHIPRSGTVEVHNESVEWKPLEANVGSIEDTNTARSVLTNVASGTGIAKTWLAEPEDANRAVSLSMAEPVRRRVGGVQNVWLKYIREMVSYAVDQAVAARRLDPMVETTDEAGKSELVAASKTVSITGPEVAAADAQITAEVLVNLAQGLTGLVAAGLLSKDAGAVAARKAWEQFVGVPYRHDLDDPSADSDEIADYIDQAQQPGAVVKQLVTA